MKTIALTLRGSRREATLMERLESYGLTDVSVYHGINAPKFGLATLKAYEVDAPGSGYKMGASELGCTLSHWTLWNTLDFMVRQSEQTGDYWMILEDDVVLLPGWRKEIESALRDLPADWDMLFPGSCCTSDKPRTEIRPGLVETTPLCTHCYIVRAKALPVLLRTNEMAWTKVDLQLYFNSFKHLKVYAILPRVAEQLDTDLPV